jgi:hypothetical protein
LRWLVRRVEASSSITTRRSRWETEWVIAGLQLLGIPSNRATATYQEFVGVVPGSNQVPGGEHTVAVRVCGKWAKRSPFASALCGPGEALRAITYSAD